MLKIKYFNTQTAEYVYIDCPLGVVDIEVPARLNQVPMKVHVNKYGVLASSVDDKGEEEKTIVFSDFKGNKPTA